MTTTSSSRSRARAVVGDTSVARDFFAGRYARVAAETFDDPSGELAREDVAFVVGALTFLGRVADAETCFAAAKHGGGPLDPRTLTAARFFLGLAYARAGDFARAHELLVAGARRRARADDPWVVAFVFQGLACWRYFTGRYRAAARHALVALRAGYLARFAYAQMLSTDLRGHALVQLGQLQAGLAVLAQAKGHAERLGFGMNAHAIACSMVVYQARFKVGPEALRDLEALLDRRSHDSYSRRALITQAAMAYALRGRGAEARAALDQADRDALRSDARRAKLASLIARLYVTRFSHGARACAEILEEATALVEPGDVAFRAELLAFEALVAQAHGDADRRARAVDGLRRLAEQTEHHAARAALDQLDEARTRAFAEDEHAAILGATVRRDERALPRVLALGLLGAVPELLGLTPGRRVILLSTENAVLIEDHGELWLRPSPPRWVPPLLALLSAGSAPKEAIVARLWSLRRYRPERHDPLVRTTIHRLRAFLDPRGEWVTVTAEGYGLAVPVHVSGAVDAGEPLDAPLPEEEPIDEAPPRLPPARDTEASDRAVHERLAHGGEASVPELSRSLSLSESTVLRALRRLVKARKVIRAGAARATRYRARG